MKMDTYITDSFANKVTEHLVNGEDCFLIDFLKENGYLDCVYYSFEDAIEALGITEKRDIFDYAIRICSPDNVNIGHKLFKIEDGVLTSGNKLTDLYKKQELYSAVRTCLKQGYFGKDNWVLYDYTREYTTVYRNGKKIGMLFAYNDMHCGTMEVVETLIAKVRNGAEEDIVVDLMEDLEMAYISEE